MQLNNLSVAKKVWFLVGAVMVLLMAATFGMARYMTHLEATLRGDMQALEKRTRLVVKLRSDIEIGATSIVAAAFAHDAASRHFFEDSFREIKASNVRVMTTLQSELRNPQAQQLLQQVFTLVARADQQIADLEVERRSGGDLGEFVRVHLSPTITQAIDLLEQMVVVQEQQLQVALAQGDHDRTEALSWVVGVFVLVALGALLLARALIVQVTQPLARAVSVANDIAQGNLTRDVQDSRKDELGALLGALQMMTLKLRGLVGEVREGVTAVSSAAAQIQEGNVHVSSRTEQAAASLEETAASLEELTATVTQSADIAHQAHQLVTQAMQAAQRGGEVVGQVVSSMEHINTSSRKINDIIGVIDGIAFQTNILALNAAVEAARAGEQGRGFAVVAGEVRTLAQRSAEAAKEIKHLIVDSVHSVDQGSAQVAQAGESMQDIVVSVRRVTDLIGEIAASAQEQRDGIAQVNQAMGNLDQMTQQNAALVEESGAAATAMNEQAQRLQQQVANFRTDGAR